MKSFILSMALVVSQFAMANPPPANYPLVNGIVKKIAADTQKVTIKHDEIPNLDMPAMTMSFKAAQPDLLKDLAVGESIRFAADEVNGELTLLWWEKATLQ
jgi:Cu/Ag efflux protein CusF